MSRPVPNPLDSGGAPGGRPLLSGARGVALLCAGTALFAAVVIMATIPAGALGFPLDDAWIHMVYARAVAFEGGLHYNPGEPGRGCTSLLWPLVVAPVFRLTGSADGVVRAVQGLGAGLHAAASALAALIVGSLLGPPGRRWALLAGLTVALCPPLLVAALSGMEVTLTAALLCGMVFLALRAWPQAAAEPRARNAWEAGLLAGLVCWARPEGMAPVLLLLLLWSLASLRTRSWLRSLLPFALPVFAALAVSTTRYLLATGRLVTSTYHVKQELSLLELLPRLGTAMLALLSRVPPFWGLIAWLALLALPFAMTGDARQRGRLLLPWGTGLGFLLANLAVMPPIDPGAFYHLRYLLPPVPLLTAAVTVAVALFARRLRAPFPFALRFAFPALCLAGILATAVPAVRGFHQDCRNINEVQRALGTWLGSVTRPGDWIAVTDAGALRFFSGRATIDLLGLNTPLPDADQPALAPPVSFLVLMPAWVQPAEGTRLHVVQACSTSPYTVTSSPAMALQGAMVCGDEAGPAPQLVRLRGVTNVSLTCRPWSRSERERLALTPAASTCTPEAGVWGS